MSSGGLTYEEALLNHVKHLRLVLQRLREKKLAESASNGQHYRRGSEVCGQCGGLWSQVTRSWEDHVPRKVGQAPAQSVRLGRSSFSPISTRKLSASMIIMRPPFTPCSNSPSQNRKGSNHFLHGTPEQDTAFQELKRELLKPLALFLVNPKAFVMRTDASD